ncbi:MAG: adenylate kinase [Acidobacteriaceae bacterium]
MARFIVLLGPPGAGKGTQAKAISASLNLPHISSGDLFREHITQQTGLGILAAGFINKGELVPDDVTIAMIRERLAQPDCAEGALLDGFPRTPAQAEALARLLAGMHAQVDSVPYIGVPEEVLVSRLSGRWTCREAGHVFHEQYNPPQEPGRCDIDGSPLYQREDDKAETVKRRVHVYMEQTQPLIEYYRQRGVLVEINGKQPIEQVTADILAAIDRKVRKE